MTNPEATPGSAPQAAPGQPAVEPSAATPAAQPTGALQDEYIRVQRDQFKQWPGGYKEALGRAKLADQMEGFIQDRFNMPLNDWMAMVSESLDAPLEPGETPAQPPETPQETPPLGGVTEDRLIAVLDERDKAKAGQDAERQEREGRTRDEQNVHTARVRHVEEALKSMNFGPDEKGVRPDGAEKLGRFFNAFLDEAMQDDIPEFLRSKSGYLMDVWNRQAPSDAQVARAKENLGKWLASLTTRGIADFAAGQAPNQTPGATLGPGAGGKQPPKSAKDMTQADIHDFMASGVPDNLVPPGS